MSEGLAHGPYVAARAGVEPTTLRTKGVDSTKAPPRPTSTVKHLLAYCILFIHLYSTSHSMSLSEAFPTTAIDTVGVYTPKRYRQLQVKDLPKVLTWRLEWDSNLRPSGRKALNPTTEPPRPMKPNNEKEMVLTEAAALAAA